MVWAKNEPEGTKSQSAMKEIRRYTLNEYVSCLDEAHLLAGYDLKGMGNIPVTGLTYNSKEAAPGTLFICKGAAFKEAYLEDAAGRGAIAFVSAVEYETDLPYIITTDIRKAMSVLSSFFFCAPQDEMKLVGITGTKGKTTTTYFIKAIIDDYMAAEGGKESALISTIETYDGVIREESHITTPEAVELVGHLRNAVCSGIEYGAVEVSSQALKYDRVGPLTFDVGIFLNIAEDHISPNEHADFDDYLQSKLKIFERSKTAVVNLGTDELPRVLNAAVRADSVITFGTAPDADFRAENIRKEGSNTVFTCTCKDFSKEFTLEMPGLFNVDNALAAIAAAHTLGIPTEYIKSGLLRAHPTGRMDVHSSKDGKIVVIVDYAHNKLSYKALFESGIKEYPGRRVVGIFGAAGGKAFNRRKDLGTLAAKYSDYIIITADNPGDEPFDNISEQIAKYVKEQGCPFEVIEDRGEAIKKAVADVTEPTLIIFAGTGHMTYQKYNGVCYPRPSDVDYTKACLEEYDAVNN